MHDANGDQERFLELMQSSIALLALFVQSAQVVHQIRPGNRVHFASPKDESRPDSATVYKTLAYVLECERLFRQVDFIGILGAAMTFECGGPAGETLIISVMAPARMSSNSRRVTP